MNPVRPKLEIIQVLRAAAALFVVVSHSAHEVVRFLSSDQLQGFDEKQFPGDFGVDLFFVISGFIMVFTSWNSFGRSGAAADFMARRIIRIVPLYWMATTAMIAIVILMPSVVNTATSDKWQWLTSYLFIPYAREGDGLIRPVLGLGWSLQYEMFFYLVFAAGLAFSRPAGLLVPLVVIPLAVIAAQSATGESALLRFLSHPIMLEFVGGVMLGIAYMRGIRFSPFWGLTFAATGIVLLLLAPPFNDFVDHYRHVHYGGPAILMVAAAVLSRGAEHARMPAPFVQLGEASYSLYLLHPFIVGLIAVLMIKAGVTGLLHPALIAGFYFFCVIAVSVLGATLVHSLFDEPFTGWLRKNWPGARSGRPA